MLGKAYCTTVAITTQVQCERKHIVMVARAGSGSSASTALASGSAAAEQPAEEPEQTSAAAARWAALVRHFQRLRRLQRYWGLLGGHIQTYPASLRDRLRETDPAPARRR